MITIFLLIAFECILLVITKRPSAYTYVETYKYVIDRDPDPYRTRQSSPSQYFEDDEKSKTLKYNIVPIHNTQSSTLSEDRKQDTFQFEGNYLKCSYIIDNKSCKPLLIDSPTYDHNQSFWLSIEDEPSMPKSNTSRFIKCNPGTVICQCDILRYQSVNERRICYIQSASDKLTAIFSKMSTAKKVADERLYYGVNKHSGYIYYNTGNDFIQVDGEWKAKTLNISGYKNSKWILARGFDIPYIYDYWNSYIIFALRDDEKHKIKLHIYRVLNFTDQMEPEIIVENLKNHAFSNFGHKITTGDINGDYKIDILVSSPTSSWLDLPAVGHVEIFIHRISFPFYDNNPIFVRGKPIPLSFFGFSVASDIDLKSHLNADFMVSALKISESDENGGIYIFFGSSEETLKQSTFYEIITPQPRAKYELPSFGFSINTKFGLRKTDARSLSETHKEYLLISRFTDNEVDIYELDRFQNSKVDIKISSNYTIFDEEFMKTLTTKRLIPLNIKICMNAGFKHRYIIVRLSFKHDYSFCSFHPELRQNRIVSNLLVNSRICLDYSVYIRPWLEKIPPRLIIYTEIDIVYGSGVQKKPDLEHPKIEIYSNITLDKSCRATDCVENYTLTLEKDPIFCPNTDEPIIFDFNLTNYGDFMTHFILKADLSLPCQLLVIDPETHRYHLGFDTINYYSDSKRAHITTVYPLVVPHNDFIIFYVEALCPPFFDYKTPPHLNMTIQSLLPYTSRSFTFQAKVETEFSIKTPEPQHNGIQACGHIKDEITIEFSFEIILRGIIDDTELYLEAALSTNEPVDAKVISVDIQTNVCGSVSMRDTANQTEYLSVQEFAIKLTCIADDMKLFYTAKMHLKILNDTPFVLSVKSLNTSQAEYSYKNRMNQEADHHFVIRMKVCSWDTVILITMVLMITFSVSVITWTICYKREKRVIRVRNPVTYVTGR